MILAFLLQATLSSSPKKQHINVLNKWTNKERIIINEIKEIWSYPATILFSLTVRGAQTSTCSVHCAPYLQ